MSEIRTLALSKLILFYFVAYSCLLVISLVHIDYILFFGKKKWIKNKLAFESH